MLTYNSKDVFTAEKSPEMVKELYTLKEKTAHTPVYFKTEIIISFLKKHSIKNEWIEANPVLTKLMTSNYCTTNHIEDLFSFYYNNKPYLLSYETYIRNIFLNVFRDKSLQSPN